MKILDGHGNEMVYVKMVEPKGDDLVMKVTLMGSMPSTVYLKPKEMWAAKSLISWKLIKASLIMMIKGWKSTK